MHNPVNVQISAVGATPFVPGFAQSTSTRTILWIKASLYVAGFVTVACWVAGIWTHIIGAGNLIVVFEGREYTREIILFFVALVLTFVHDALGYVHTISLRWALYREGRLEYNTNLRLFTAARTTFANRWFMNMLYISMLNLSYACSSLILIRTKTLGIYDTTRDSIGDAIAVNAMALILLGFALLVQTLLALLCLRQYSTQIPTWSASPLANTLTALYGHSGLQHRPGRCMMPVTQMLLPAQASQPRSQQPRLWNMRFAKWIVLFVWILFLLILFWASAIVKLVMQIDDLPSFSSFRFEWTPEYIPIGMQTGGVVMLGMSPNQNWPFTTTAFPPEVQILMAILLFSLIQGVQALGLHCVELLVNMTRDELLWQRTGCGKGALIGSEPLFAAFASWRTVALTCLKTVLHWLLGQSLVVLAVVFEGEPEPDFYGSEESYLEDLEAWPAFYGSFVVLNYASRLLIFAGVFAVTALFATSLAVWKIKGPQPAAWGHLQTLADLVDDWRTIDGRIWWGDKGGDDVFRHAGTAHAPELVGSIDMQAYYAGAPDEAMGERTVRSTCLSRESIALSLKSRRKA